MNLYIYRNQLKLEIDTETRKAGFFQVDPNNQEAVNEAQLGSEFSDKAYFERKCQQGIDSLLDVLHKFVISCNEENREQDEANNVLEDTKCWNIEVKFDGRRNIISRSLASVCHKYIAYNMLYSWAVMTMPNLVAEYKDQRAATLLDIQRIVYRKESPVLESDEDGSETDGEGVSYQDKVEALEKELQYLKDSLRAFNCTSAAADAVKSINQNVRAIPGNSHKVWMEHANTASGTVKYKFGTNGTALPLYYKGAPVSPTNTWSDGITVEMWLVGGTWWFCKPWYEATGGGTLQLPEMSGGIELEPVEGEFGTPSN